MGWKTVFLTFSKWEGKKNPSFSAATFNFVSCSSRAGNTRLTESSKLVGCFSDALHSLDTSIWSKSPQNVDFELTNRKCERQCTELAACSEPTCSCIAKMLIDKRTATAAPLISLATASLLASYPEDDKGLSEKYTFYSITKKKRPVVLEDPDCCSKWLNDSKGESRLVTNAGLNSTIACRFMSRFSGWWLKNVFNFYTVTISNLCLKGMAVLFLVRCPQMHLHFLPLKLSSKSVWLFAFTA